MCKYTLFTRRSDTYNRVRFYRREKYVYTRLGVIRLVFESDMTTISRWKIITEWRATRAREKRLATRAFRHAYAPPRIALVSRCAR